MEKPNYVGQLMRFNEYAQCWKDFGSCVVSVLDIDSVKKQTKNQRGGIVYLCKIMSISERQRRYLDDWARPCMRDDQIITIHEDYLSPIDGCCVLSVNCPSPNDFV